MPTFSLWFGSLLLYMLNALGTSGCSSLLYTIQYLLIFFKTHLRKEKCCLVLRCNNQMWCIVLWILLVLDLSIFVFSKEKYPYILLNIDVPAFWLFNTWFFITLSITAVHIFPALRLTLHLNLSCFISLQKMLFSIFFLYKMHKNTSYSSDLIPLPDWAVGYLIPSKCTKK